MSYRDYYAKELARRYPYQFEDNGWDQLPDGWMKLFGAVCGLVDESLPTELKTSGQGIVWTQCKEKFGGARLYCKNVDDDALSLKISKIIMEAEALSFTVCQECGKRGERRFLSGWHATLCDFHYAAPSE